jgi:A/G-specific adenine glycosylase
MYEPLNAEGFLSREELVQLLAGLTNGVKSIRGLPGARHIFSHVEWRMQAWEIDTARFPPPENAVWARRGDFAVPAAFRYWDLFDTVTEYRF